MTDDEIVHAATCPVCLEMPRPRPAQEYGLCTAGHLLCSGCSKVLIAAKTPCPVCKHPDGVKLQRHHHLAYLVLRHATRNLLYQCRECKKKIKGQDLADHEEGCNIKRVACPLCLEPQQFLGALADFDNHLACFSMGNFESIVGGGDTCCWDVAIPMENIMQNIRFKGKPIHFLLSAQGVPDFKAYVSLTSFGDGLEGKAYWLDSYDRAPPYAKSLDLMFELFFYTYEGPISATQRLPVLFSDKASPIPNPFIRLFWRGLENMVRMDDEHKPPRGPCIKCNVAPKHFHVVLETRWVQAEQL